MIHGVDCKTCQLRRIKCDRGLPGCGKCAKRRLECPGYGLKLKWTQCVASRGKLQGKAIPLQNASEESLPLQRGLDGIVSSIRVAEHQNSIPGSPSNACLLGAQTPHTPQLLLYFMERVACRLAWVDGPENPWRQIVLPLLQHSETVFSSILALTAHDMASQYPPDDFWREKLQKASKSYESKALGLLNQELNILRRLPDSRPPTKDVSIPALASSIILCNAELLTAPEARWRVHLQGAQDVVQAEADRLCLQQHADRIDEFFLQEFYTTSVFAHLTCLHEIDEITQVPLLGSRDAVFTDLMRVIHQITQAERIKARAQLLQLPQPDIIPFHNICAQLELARRSAVCLGQAIQFWTDNERRAFEHLIWMYFHASLAYAYQALADPHTAQTSIGESRDAILMHLQFLSGTGNEMFAQNLVWPLFIAGTELKSNRTNQRLIERHLTTVMRVSRSLDRGRVMSFLKDWWALPDGECVSWIELIRKKGWTCGFFLA